MSFDQPTNSENVLNFNLLEVMSLRSHLTKLLSHAEELLRTDTFSLTREPDLDSDGRLYTFILKLEKTEQIRDVLNETLSLGILNDRINSGKLHKLTKEETTKLAVFLFPQK